MKVPLQTQTKESRKTFFSILILEDNYGIKEIWKDKKKCFNFEIFIITEIFLRIRPKMNLEYWNKSVFFILNN